jgi:hypothetical protein
MRRGIPLPQFSQPVVAANQPESGLPELIATLFFIA